MADLNYQLIVNQDHQVVPLSTKRHVDLIIKEVKQDLKEGDLQVKIEEQPDARVSVSVHAQTPLGPVHARKKGRRVVSALKKAKKAFLRQLRDRRKKRRVKKRRVRKHLLAI